MSNKVLVWDLPIRIFHWLLASAFFVAYVSEEDVLTLHVWSGYLIGSLLIFRVLWGMIGNRYARFSNFICGPAAALNYLKDVLGFKAQRYLGHNPAGAWMIIMLLISLSLTTLSGLIVYAADQQAGPLAGFVTGQYEDLWEESHEFFANLTLFLVIFHILGVLLESFVHGENLIRSMWYGDKHIDEQDQ